MRSYYVHGPDHHHFGPGVPPAAYAMPCPSNTPQGYPVSSPTSPGVMMHPTSVTSFMSPFPSLFDAERLFTPLHGFNLPTAQSPFAGPRPEPPMLQGGAVARSFTQTSYSADGVQTTYSVSTVSRPNDEGGVDVYRTRKTTVCALQRSVCISNISVHDPFCHSDRLKMEPAPQNIKWIKSS
jgi:hypothetical protein